VKLDAVGREMLLAEDSHKEEGIVRMELRKELDAVKN
jgi:hypothetical protein